MDAAQREALGARARELMREHDIPGAAIGVFESGDETIMTLGLAGDDPPRDVDANTIFQIGSITKTFTALALMRKVEAGALDLNAPLKHYLPEFRLVNPDWSARITSRNLLTHTASWDGDLGSNELATSRGDDVLERVLVEWISHAPLHTAPGTVFHYNNLAFSVAGRLLEVLHGTTFERAIEELVMDPLGLEVFFDPELRPLTRVALGHPETDVPRSDWPAGGAQCDVQTMLRYARAHLGAKFAISGTAASEQTLAAMWSPAVEMDHCPRYLGLSWMLDAIDDCAIVSHGGNTRGQVALLELIPSRNFAIVALTNSKSGDWLCWQAAKWAREHLLNLVRPDSDYFSVNESALDQYLGAYSRPGSTWHIELCEGSPDGALAIRGADRWASMPSPIEFVRPDVFVVTSGPCEDDQGTFIRGGDGEIRWLRWWGRLHERGIFP